MKQEYKTELDKLIGSLPKSVLTKKQVKKFGPVRLDDEVIIVEVRHDDECNNGHNTFSITADIYGMGRIHGESTIEFGGRTWWMCGGGCAHEEVAKAFPELAPFIKWHLCSSDMPMHYIANTVYHAGDRDHWGLNKGEFRQHKSRGPNQNGGVEGVPNWELRIPDNIETDVYSHEKPAPVMLEWVPSGITGEGKKRELDHARSSAIWPDATDDQLCLPEPELVKLLLARLPKLMADFKAAVESLGFTY